MRDFINKEFPLDIDSLIHTLNEAKKKHGNLEVVFTKELKNGSAEILTILDTLSVCGNEIGDPQHLFFKLKKNNSLKIK